jgi:hypothetical protein
MHSRFRLDLITVLLVLIALTAAVLGGFRLFKPPAWVPFEGPGFTISFPDGPPQSAELVAALIDLDQPEGDDRRARAERFKARGGTIAAWSRTSNGDTFTAGYFAHPAERGEEVRAILTGRIEGEAPIVGEITNAVPISEGRAKVGANLPARLVLVTRSTGARLLVLHTFTGGRSYFLTVERPGDTLTATDERAAAFFRSFAAK